MYVSATYVYGTYVASTCVASTCVYAMGVELTGARAWGPKISPGARGACWEKLQGQYARNLGDDMKHITRCVLKMVETDSGEKTYHTVDATVRSRGDMTIVTIADVQPGIDLKIYVERLATVRAHDRELCVPSMN